MSVLSLEQFKGVCERCVQTISTELNGCEALGHELRELVARKVKNTMNIRRCRSRSKETESSQLCAFDYEPESRSQNTPSPLPFLVLSGFMFQTMSFGTMRYLCCSS